MEKANTVGVDVSLNAALVRMIKEIEEGKRNMYSENVEELLSETRGKSLEKNRRRER